VAGVLSILALALVPGIATGAHHRKPKPRPPAPHEFDVIYRGTGTWAYNSRFTYDNGCAPTIDGKGEFAFEQEWLVKAKVKGDTTRILQIDHRGGPEPLGGIGDGMNGVSIKGGVTNPDCSEAVYRGTYNCHTAQLRHTSIDHLLFSRQGARFLITAEGISGDRGHLSGQDTISLDHESCDAFLPKLPTPFSAFGPELDAWGQVPVKQATLAHLRLRHHFRVSVSLGHYTTGSLRQYRNGCLGIQDHNAQDFCTVSSDQFSGQFSVSRVR
jgi:hypothetical protein